MSDSVSRQPTNHVPEPVVSVAHRMSGFCRRWALSGGWAVDAWIGRQTRDHGDVDIAVFQDDLRALYRHLAGWDLLAHDRNWDADTSEQWDGRPLELPAHIHGRSPEEHGPLPEDGIATLENGFWLDVQINERSGSDWLFSREHGISMPLRRCIRRSAWGLPTLIPEALLFYKAREVRVPDNRDFSALRRRLSGQQRGWLRDAISLAGHPWLPQLSP